MRCRVNAFCTARGVGLAIRFLAPFHASIERLNLHPDLKSIAKSTHGLVIVSGPTGSGKSSTLAALIEEVNRTERRHVVTIESPIEYTPCRTIARTCVVASNTARRDRDRRGRRRSRWDPVRAGAEAAFARILNVSPRTVQAWETDARRPSDAALKLLAVAKAHPEVLLG